MSIAFFKTILDDRVPFSQNKVRATCHILAIICKPDTDPITGEDLTHGMMITNIDINGNIPKWMVNFAAKQAPG